MTMTTTNSNVTVKRDGTVLDGEGNPVGEVFKNPDNAKLWGWRLTGAGGRTVESTEETGGDWFQGRAAAVENLVAYTAGSKPASNPPKGEAKTKGKAKGKGGAKGTTEGATNGAANGAAVEGASARQIANAVSKLESARRRELYAQLHDGQEPPKTASVSKLSSAIAKALLGQPLPDDVTAKLSVNRRRKGDGTPKPSLRGLFRELAQRAGGVTIGELREEAESRGIKLKGTKVAESDGRLKAHVVWPAKASGWKFTEKDDRIFGKAPKA